MELIYNVDFCLATMIIDAILYLCLCTQRGNSNTDNIFRTVVFLSFICATLDFVTSVTITYGTIIPNWVNYVLNGTMFFATTLLALYMCFYVIRYVETKENKYFKHAAVLMMPALIHLALLISNIFTGWIFVVDGNYYAHGPLYVVNVIMPAIYVLFIIFVFFKNGTAFDASHRFSITLLFVSGVTGSVLQFAFFPDVLILTFAISVCLIPVWFTMESPDYRAMIEAMEALEKEKIRANSANKAKSDFLANMSHEIRTPIHTVLGMNEMILRENQDKNIRYYASNIKSAGQALLILINDILDISKIESGEVEISEGEYELSSLINDSVSMINGRLKDEGLELVLQLDETLPQRLYGDMGRLRQTLVNLLNDSIKYTKRGFIILAIEGTVKDDDMLELVIKVKDTGGGISKEERANIFKKYRDLASGLSEVIRDGSGIGLDVTIDLLSAMGADFELESIQGVGTVFTAKILQRIVDWTPVGHIDLNQSEEMMSIDLSSKGKFKDGSRILVVDDVDSNREIISLLLKDANVEIDEASNGKDAVEMSKQLTYDCILMDHMMPGMDGIETLHGIRSVVGGKNMETPVVMVTANAIVGMREKFLSEGFNGYLTKPIKAHELELMLEKYIQKA